MEIIFAIYHLDGRVLRGDGKLVIEAITDISLIPTFNSREEARKFLDDTKLIPKQYKTRYFRVGRLGWRTL